MSDKQFNVNELLERKKQLEEQEVEIRDGIEPKDLVYTEEEVVDHTNNKNNRSVIPRKKQTLAEFSQKYNGVVDELKKCKVAIQKFNADNVLGMIQERDSTRKKLLLLDKLKEHVPRENRFGRKVTRQDKDGVALETVEIKEEPMFTREEIDAKYDELAAQERKLNTGIQKENLNAKITM